MRHRHRLPQLDAARPFLTDGGLETTLIFHRGLDLPCFAAFDLLKTTPAATSCAPTSRPTSASPASAASASSSTPRPGAPTPTGRAARLLARRPRRRQPRRGGAGRGDPRRRRGEGDADRHQRRDRPARRRLRPRRADVARRGRGLPRAPGRDVRRQRGRHGHRGDDDPRRGGHRHRPRRPRARRAGGHLLHGRDRRAPARRPAAARRHRARRRRDRRVGRLLHDQLRAPDRTSPTCSRTDGAWRERIGGLRANASAKSHAELDEAEELDEGDPAALGAEHGALRPRLGSVAVLGGCCGTDCRHVEAIGRAWMD